MAHELLFAHRFTGELLGDPTLRHDDDAVRSGKDGFRLRRQEEDRYSLGRKHLDQIEHFSLSPDVHAPRRLVQDQQLWRTREPLRKNDLLLIPPAQVAGEQARVRGRTPVLVTKGAATVNSDLCPNTGRTRCSRWASVMFL